MSEPSTPTSGMWAMASQRSRTSRDRPAPSAPMTRATAWSATGRRWIAVSPPASRPTDHTPAAEFMTNNQVPEPGYSVYKNPAQGAREGMTETQIAGKINDAMMNLGCEYPAYPRAEGRARP